MATKKSPPKTFRVVVHLDQIQNPTGYGPPLVLQPWEAPPYLTEREVAKAIAKNVDDDLLASHPQLMTDFVRYLADKASTRTVIEWMDALAELSSYGLDDHDADSVVQQLTEGGLLMSGEDAYVVRGLEAGAPPPFAGAEATARWALEQVGVDADHAPTLLRDIAEAAWNSGSSEGPRGLTLSGHELDDALEKFVHGTVSAFKPQIAKLSELLQQGNIVIEDLYGDWFYDEEAAGQPTPVVMARLRDMLADAEERLSKHMAEEGVEDTDDLLGEEAQVAAHRRDYLRDFIYDRERTLKKREQDSEYARYREIEGPAAPPDPFGRSIDAYAPVKGTDVRYPAFLAGKLRHGDVIPLDANTLAEVVTAKPIPEMFRGKKTVKIELSLRLENGKLLSRSYRAEEPVPFFPKREMRYAPGVVVSKPAPAPAPAPVPAAPKPRTARKPAARKPAETHKPAHILDADLTTKLVSVEGPDWLYVQNKDPLAPTTLSANRQAYEVLVSLGPDGTGLKVSDLLPGAGIITGKWHRAGAHKYFLAPDGRVVVDVATIRSKADESKLAKLGIMAVKPV